MLLEEIKPLEVKEVDVSFAACPSMGDAESFVREIISRSTPKNSKYCQILDSTPARAAGSATGLGLPPLQFKYRVSYYK